MSLSVALAPRRRHLSATLGRLAERLFLHLSPRETTWFGLAIQEIELAVSGSSLQNDPRFTLIEYKFSSVPIYEYQNDWATVRFVLSDTSLRICDFEIELPGPGSDGCSVIAFARRIDVERRFGFANFRSKTDEQAERRAAALITHLQRLHEILIAISTIARLYGFGLIPTTKEISRISDVLREHLDSFALLDDIPIYRNDRSIIHTIDRDSSILTKLWDHISYDTLSIDRAIDVDFASIYLSSLSDETLSVIAEILISEYERTDNYVCLEVAIGIKRLRPIAIDHPILDDWCN